MSDLDAMSIENWTKIVKDDEVETLVMALRNNLEPYGAVVLGSAINVMAALATGAEPKAAAEDVSNELTGFQMGAVASMVSQLSPRGEKFRRWWNLDQQLGHEGERANEEGGVLNPALLNIGEE